MLPHTRRGLTGMMTLDYFAATLSFVRAAELSSFSKAAQALAIKTSTISRHIGELERDLQIALFNRSTRGLALTEGGKTFLPLARQALAALEEARQVTAELNHSPQGRLRVLLPNAFGRRRLLPHLPAFMHDYPEIAIDAVVSDEQLPLIESGIDLAISIGAPGDSGLMGRRLLSVCEHLVASEAYLRQHGTPAHPDELNTHVCLVDGRGGDTRWHLRNNSTQETLVLRPTGRFHCNDVEMLLGLVQAGQGLAVLPDWLIKHEPVGEPGPLRTLLDDWQAGSERGGVDIWAIYPPKKTVSSKVRAFVDFFASALAADESTNGSSPSQPAPPNAQN